MDEGLNRLEREIVSDPNNLEALRRLVRALNRSGQTFQGRAVSHWFTMLDSPHNHEVLAGMKVLPSLGVVARLAVPRLRELRNKVFYLTNEHGEVDYQGSLRQSTRTRVAIAELLETLTGQPE